MVIAGRARRRAIASARTASATDAAAATAGTCAAPARTGIDPFVAILSGDATNHGIEIGAEGWPGAAFEEVGLLVEVQRGWELVVGVDLDGRTGVFDPGLARPNLP